MTEQERLNNMVDKELIGNNKHNSKPNSKPKCEKDVRLDKMYDFLHQMEEKIEILRIVSVNKDKKIEIYRGMVNHLIASHDNGFIDCEIVNGIREDLANIDEG